MNKKAFQGKPGDTVGGRRRILVIDGSRVVRATLAKRLGDRFEVVEEANGESAWQRLMLDGSIAAVISGIHPPRLDAHDLLARLRTSAMRRLREIPFILLISEIETQAAPGSGDWSDATGFITKSMSTEVMVAHLDQWVGLHAATPETESGPAAVPAPAVEKLMGRPEFSSLVSSLSLSAAENLPVCALVFGIDRLDELIAAFGPDVAEILTSRIAGSLAAKIDPQDHLGLFGKQRLAIISYGVDLRLGTRFAKRVCKSLASGRVTIRGQKIRMTVSIGIASTSDDKVGSGPELLSLADQRLEQALVCGGNTVCTEHRPDCPLHCQDRSVAALFEVLKRDGGDLLPEQRSVLGLTVLPLLQTLESRLSLGLPLQEIKHRLARQAAEDGTPP